VTHVPAPARAALTPVVRLLAVVIVWLAAPAGTRAHEVRPGYLEINQTAPQAYAVIWKQPTLGEIAVHLAPRLSNGWLKRPPVDQYAADYFLIRRWSVASAAPLAGVSVAIDGLPETITDVFVRVRWLDGRRQDVILRPESPSFVIADPTERAATGVPGFLVLGVEHILTGLDHLLVLLGLILLVRDRWMLLKTVTAFTVAHSLTLALAVLCHVQLSTPVLNTLIALSVLFLAPEVMRARRRETSLTIRHPWIVSFAFGLLHGMGFASGLTGLGLDRADLVSALLSFNVGVEIGQLAFLALVLALVRAFRLLEIRWPRPVALAPTYAIGVFGATWTFQYGAAALGFIR